MNDKKKIIEQFLKLHCEGENIKSLCSRFGICKSTAYNWIREYTPIRKPYKGRIITPTDYRKLERAKHTLQIENEIFHRSSILSKISLEDKIEIIESLNTDFSIHILCKTLGILKSTYYHRKLRSPEKKWYEIDDEMLCPIVKKFLQTVRNDLAHVK